MAKDHTFDIDLEEWELIPEDRTLLYFTHGSSGAGGKRSFTGKDPSFRSKEVAGAAAEFDSPIFLDNDDDDPKDIVVVNPAASNADDRTFYLAKQEYKDIGVVPPPLKKKTEENEFADLKMKVVDCASLAPMAIVTTTTQMELQAVDQKKPSLSEEEEQEQEGDPEEEEVIVKEDEEEGHRPPEQKSCWDGIGISILGWRFVGIGAICSVAAAATICTIVVLGGRQMARNQNQNLQLQVYPGDEGAASKLNQAMAAESGGGVTPFVARASVSSGGYFDWL